MSSYPSLGPLSKHLADYPWPGDFFKPDNVPAFLNAVYLLDYRVDASATGLSSVLRLAFEGELAVALPGFDGVKLVLGGGDIAGVTFVTAALVLGDQTYLELQDIRLALRFDPSILKPVAAEGGEAADFVEIRTSGSLRIDDSFDLTCDGFEDLELTPAMIGDSGVVVSAQGVKIHLSRTTSAPWITAAGFDESFIGVFISEATVTLPSDLPALAPSDLVIRNCAIGSGGFTGKLEANYPGLGETSEIFGMSFRLKHVALELRQNAFVQSEIIGEMLLPFFDRWAEVEIGFDVSGGFHVRLTNTDGEGLKKIDTQAFSMEVDSIAFEVKDGLFTTKLSGKLTPLFGGLKWPTFDVKELSIDSKGHVHLDGGWLKLPEQKTFDFHGFKIEITQLGFGKNDDGGKWIGFSGGVHLVDGLPQGGSVEGLRITWYEDGRDPKISLNGAGVELLIPDVLYFKGAVSYREIADGANTIHRFDGDIRLVLATPELDIDGTIVIGSVNGPQGRYNFFAIYVDADLPVGIPLAATGLSFYGFAGLFALQMEPNKKSDEMWFSIDHSKSFYHRDTPGITDLAHKWGPKKGSFAIGAGITLGTTSDNGYSFYGKFLLAIVIPGPIILLQGAAQFLKKQKDANDEGQFRALAVLDGRAGSILIGLDAEYKTGKGGEMIEIGGSMEAFYAFHDPMAWHLWLGKDEPRSLRIRALFGRFVEANAYFMLDAHALALGAWFGYSNGWNFGPLSIRLEAWAEGNAKLSFKPSHFHGDISIHCLVELGAFGLELGIALDAMIAADLFTPYHLIGKFSVGIKLPWPFKKKIGATVTLEWGPRPKAPPLPLPVKQIAVEHFKSTVVWLLPRDKYLLPNWDDGEGFVRTPPTGVSQPDLTTVPLVPLDARISVTFGRSVHDDAFVGITPHPITPDQELIGPPGGPAVASVRYSLKAIELSQREANGSWQLVAKSPATTTVPRLFGSWMPVPQLPGPSAANTANTKLLLWSKSPFDFTRATGSSWEEWVSDAMPGYPCIPVLPLVETCFDFEEIKSGTLVKSPWVHHGSPDVTLSWGFGPATAEVVNVVTGTDRHQVFALCFPEAAVRGGITVRSSEPGRALRIVFAPAAAPSEPKTSLHADLSPEPGVATPSVARGTFSFGAPAPPCIDIRGHEAGTLINPWTSAGVRFTVFGANGVLLQQARIERWGNSPLGLNAGFRLDIQLPCASPWVELIVTHRPPFRIIAFNGAGTAVATHAPFGTGGETTETIRLQGDGITRLEVHASGNEKLVHSVCYQCTAPTGPVVTWYDDHGNPHGPIVPTDSAIVVPGPRVDHVVLTGDSGLCIAKICVTADPDAGQVVGREEMIEHTREQLVHWHDEGDVLAPNTTYRLMVQTLVHPTSTQVSLSDVNPVEYAYFRTEGPPGLTKLPPPDGVTTTDFDSGLDDLVRYVKETDPPTVPPAGEKPILFRPFYRAYDLGVEFNENYVEQMYRMDRRDLGLYLFDNSNQPVHDTKGRLLVLESQWGAAPTITLTDKETRWITLIDAATCLPKKLDPVTFPHAATLTSSTADRVLAPDTLHEARLVPLLLHETFAALPLGDLAPQSSGWYADDSGAGGPSHWQIGEVGEPASRFVEQLSPIGSSTADRSGTVLLLDSGNPAAWSDYRVSVYVRSDAGGAVGLIVRYLGAGTGYRFSLDSKVRSLVKLGPGVTAEVLEHFAYQKKRDYLLTVEALGSNLRAYVDGEPVLELNDATYAKGRIGLYVCESPGARFSDVVIDDLRPSAPVAYRFQLTTSLYANFFHHLHSFQDETWKATLAADPDVDAMLNAALAPSFVPPDENEARAYETLAGRALGAAALQNSERVEITRVDRAGNAAIFLLRSPEPIDPKRTELALSQSARSTPTGIAPSALKLTDAALGANRPAEESVTLLLRDAAELTRQRIELRQLPGPLSELIGNATLLLESFRDQTSLDQFTIADTPAAGGSSLWQIENGGLVEVSGMGGGYQPELPGTHAVTGDSEWTDYRLTAALRADAGGEIGVLFRYRDEGNYYRLSLGAALSYRRLVKCVEGEMTILWQDQKGYPAGEPFQLAIEAVGARLSAFVADTRIFDVTDNAHAAGRVGLYASANPGARFERIEVRLPSLEGRAWLTDHFADGNLDGWTLLPEAPNDAQSSHWEASGGALHLDHTDQLSEEINLALPGAYAFAGDPAWKDVILQAHVHSGGGAIGVVVRATDTDNYYRFSMSRDFGYRQLVKKVAGTLTVLWRDTVAYEANHTYELTIVAIGTSLRGYVDGVPLFAVQDADLAAGRIALYAWSNHDTSFSDVRVWPGDQAFDRWLVDDSFATLVPDRWRFVNDAGTSEPERWTAGDGLRPVVTPPAGAATTAGRTRPSRPPDQFHYALLTQPPSPDELRITVGLELDANGAAGVIFGWQDSANHLAFWLDAQRDARRLLRTRASAIEVLWEDAVRPDSGRAYLVTIDQFEGRLVGHLDGVQIFSIDTAATTGTAGLVLRDGASGRFDELRLAAPEWTCWHEFGEEERLPAGTRVRVHAAPAVTAPQTAGLVVRSVALAGERGRLRLPGNGATLRIVGSDGQPSHTRTFLPDDAFAPLALRLLRKADGTAFFIIPASAQPAGGGSLRLDLTYHRDRPAAGRRMSQAGDTTPELATIEWSR
jgi:hypothetical protein